MSFEDGRNASFFKAAGELSEALAGRLALASLDRLSVAAFIVDRDSFLHFLNAAARELLSGQCCVRLSNGRLRFEDPRWNSMFGGALQGATGAQGCNSVLPFSSRNAGIYEVTVSSLGVLQLGCAGTQPLALAVIVDPRPDAMRIVERVRHLYGLTEAEARVMAGLALGRTVDEVGIAYGVRPSTVRAQVRSIFEKTGVHRQSDLVRFALTGAPPQSPEPSATSAHVAPSWGGTLDKQRQWARRPNGGSVVENEAQIRNTGALRPCRRSS